MILKAGTYYPEDGEPTDAEWHYDINESVTIVSVDCVIVSIDPYDFMAIADAIRGRINQQNE
jgi:hypothetical protein